MLWEWPRSCALQRGSCVRVQGSSYLSSSFGEDCSVIHNTTVTLMYGLRKPV